MVSVRNETCLTRIPLFDQTLILSNSFRTGERIHYIQLPIALNKAIDRDVPKHIVDDALQVLLTEEERDDGRDPDTIEIFEFIAITVRVMVLVNFMYFPCVCLSDNILHRLTPI